VIGTHFASPAAGHLERDAATAGLRLTARAS
jgi:hypothetical protein